MRSNEPKVEFASIKNRMRRLHRSDPIEIKVKKPERYLHAVERRRRDRDEHDLPSL